MQSSAEIKKCKGIDDVVRDISPGRLETERKVEVVGESELGVLLDKYRRYLDLCKLFSDRNVDYKLIDAADIMVDLSLVLKPIQIDAFLQLTAECEEHEQYSSHTGHFVNRLLRNSYEAGNNDFTLHTEGLPHLDYLFYYFRADEKRPLVFDVIGDVGSYCAKQGYNLVLDLNGDTGDWFATQAVSSKFTLHGKLGGNSATNTYNCTFRTSREDTRYRLINNVKGTWRDRHFKHLQYSENKIIFINPDGTEEIVEDYAKRDE